LKLKYGTERTFNQNKKNEDQKEQENFLELDRLLLANMLQYPCKKGPEGAEGEVQREEKPIEPVLAAGPAVRTMQENRSALRFITSKAKVYNPMK